jgi:hypothetical protein
MHLYHLHHPHYQQKPPHYLYCLNLWLTYSNADQWHRMLTNMARAQDLSDVLNPQYVPQTTAAHDLFWGKQKVLYAVLEAKVKTAKGKSIIQQYESTYDAQKAYKKLEEHHLTSNTAMFVANKIMEYLMTVCINTDHGTVVWRTFILTGKNSFDATNIQYQPHPIIRMKRN